MAKNISREIGGEMNSINNLLIKLLESNDKTRQSIDALVSDGISQKGKATKSLDLEKKIVEDKKADRENSKKDIVEARKSVSDLEKKLSLNIAAKGTNILDAVQGFLEKENPILGHVIGGVSGLFKVQEGISKWQKARSEDKEKLAEARDNLKLLGVEEDKKQNQYKLYSLIEGFEERFFGIKKEEKVDRDESETEREKEAIQAREDAEEARRAAEKGGTSVKVTPEEKKKEEGGGILDGILPTAIGTSIGSAGGGLMAALLPLVPWALLAGGLALAIGNAFEGVAKAGDWGTSNIAAGLGGFIGGAGTGLMNVFKNMGTWAAIGAGIGGGIGIFGAGIGIFPGIIVGGLIGAAFGGIMGWIGGENLAKGFDWIGSVFRGDFIADAFGGISSWAKRGAEMGAIGWWPGMIIGGVIGGAIGGIMGWLGQGDDPNKTTNGIGAFISGIFGTQSKHISEGWEMGYGFGGPVGGVIGAILGGAFGGIIDWLSSGGITEVIDKVTQWLLAKFPTMAAAINGASAVLKKGAEIVEGGTGDIKSFIDRTFETKSQKENKENLVAELRKGGITDPAAIGNIMGTVQNESAFKPKSESMNYSASRLMEIFPKKFKSMEDAQSVVDQGQSAIGDRVYGGRMGNEEAGDGYKYRGRGLHQLTGKDNYKKYGDMIGEDLVNNPDLVNDPGIAAKLVVAYYKDKQSHGTNLSDQAAVQKATGFASATGSGAQRTADSLAYTEKLKSGEYKDAKTFDDKKNIEETVETKDIKDKAYRIFIGEEKWDSTSQADDTKVKAILDNPPSNWITQEMRNYGYQMYLKKMKLGGVPEKLQRGAYYMSIHPQKEWVVGGTSETAKTPELSKTAVTSSGTLVPTTSSTPVAGTSETATPVAEASTGTSTTATPVAEASTGTSETATPIAEASTGTALVASSSSGIVPVFVTNISQIASATDVSPKRDESGNTISNDTRVIESAPQVQQSPVIAGGNTNINSSSITNTGQSVQKGNSALNPNADIYKAVASAGTFLDFVQSVMPA